MTEKLSPSKESSLIAKANSSATAQSMVSSSPSMSLSEKWKNNPERPKINKKQLSMYNHDMVILIHLTKR